MICITKQSLVSHPGSTAHVNPIFLVRQCAINVIAAIKRAAYRHSEHQCVSTGRNLNRFQVSALKDDEVVVFILLALCTN